MAELTTVRVVGGILPPDVVSRVVAGDRDLPGLSSADFHLGSGESTREAANRAWSYLTGVWAAYREVLAGLPAGDPAVGLTRERWLLVLLRELGYGRVPTTPAGGLVAGERSFPVSHVWGATPIHLLGWGVDLDRRSPGVAGAAQAPHAMVQELVNRSGDHLWAIVSNGRSLRLLRDSTSLSGQSHVEFDLEGMFDGEVFADFVVLFLLAHQSRVEPLTPGGPVSDCWLERWRTAGIQQGTRAMGLLREGVRHALVALGTGFARGGGDLHHRLAAGGVREADYHHALLRLVYRLLFLFVAEDRGLLHPPAAPGDESARVARERYARYFSTARLRRLALSRRGTQHADLWAGLSVVLEALGRDGGRPELALAGLGGLFDHTDLDVLAGRPISNEALLTAIRHLAVVQPKGGPRQRVDYRNLGAEELGSIYESLLELVPRYHAGERTFALAELAGNDRKTTGSYYTPSALIDLVLDEALDPVLDDAVKSAPTAEEQAEALLRVTVCDPACGSGHFLVAAARRIATRVATARTEEVDPTPADVQEAMHDVVARCIHGIDLNPMAAELARVSLWLEALTPGRPLTFLDAHVKVGNALLGATPALVAKGIPDEAYRPITGDDPKIARGLRDRNQAKRDGQGDLFGAAELDVSNAVLRDQQAQLTPPRGASLAEVHAAARRLAALRSDPAYARARAVADAWCAAFVQEKTAGGVGITHDTLTAIQQGTAPAETLAAVERLAARHGFFHWHLEFPHVYPVPDHPAGTATGWTGGFACIVGNPPWERVKLQEKEFFAARAPEVAEAANAAARKKLIAVLPGTNPELWDEWQSAVRRSEGESGFLRLSGRYPLTGTGDINTYSVFAETFAAAVAVDGRAGVVTPTGLATDATTSQFFASLLGGRRLAAFYDFENEAKIFPGVHNQFRFAVTVATGGEAVRRTRLAFYTRHIAEVRSRRFALDPAEVLLLNPNTGTLPVFRSRTDAEITLGVYRRHPVLLRDGDPAGNPWGLRFGTMFHMANDSGRFQSSRELERDGAVFDGWAYVRGSTCWLPLYEAKLVGHYDHRLSTYANATQAQLNKGTLPRLTDAEHADPYREPLARYWVAEADVDDALRGRWDRDWLFGWRGIGRASDVRTFAPCAIPRAAVSGKFPLGYPANPTDAPLLQVVMSSHILDYVARQKISGTDLAFFLVRQIALPVPKVFGDAPSWLGTSLGAWMRARVLELSYTSHRIAGYARDVLRLDPDADPGPPFRWDPARRELLRAELDAAMFHLYGLARDEVDHVLHSFQVLRRYEQRDHGEFRTRRLVLEIYDAMTRAADTGHPYRTVLDPEPGRGPRHPPAR